jgi:hypothetical protein
LHLGKAIGNSTLYGAELKIKNEVINVFVVDFKHELIHLVNLKEKLKWSLDLFFYMLHNCMKSELYEASVKFMEKMVQNVWTL